MKPSTTRHCSVEIADFVRNLQSKWNVYPDGYTGMKMKLLRSNAAYGTPLSMLNLFAATNKLFSVDNRRSSLHALEQTLNMMWTLFDAVFATTYLGDVCPNTTDAKCQNQGLPCKGSTNTTNGKTYDASPFTGARLMTRRV